MKEQVVSLETAILAKEKGFNWRCEMMYCDGELMGTKISMHGNPNAYKDRYSAPTLYRLQQWLGDEYSIHDIVSEESLIDGLNKI